MKTIDVTALGELLIDFTENGVSGQGNPVFEANPGGAPCNVLSMLSRCGRKTAFIGKVGDDMFGRQLKAALEEVGIMTDGLLSDPEVHTTLALVHKLPNGDRDFSFYRKPGADIMLSADELDKRLLEEAKIFHFGSLSLTDEPARTATMQAVETAKRAGAVISFDPNLREPLWGTLDQAKEQIAWGMGVTDIMKISDNEILWFTGEKTFEDAAARLLREYPNIRLLLVSLGPDGSMAFTNGMCVRTPAFRLEETVETTGAGDTFQAVSLEFVLRYGLDGLDEDKLREMLRTANAAAAIVTTRRGALRVMPSAEEVRDFLAAHE